MAQEYPKWMYGPNEGDARIFNKDDLVPKGWEDHPEKVGKPKERKPKNPAKNTDTDAQQVTEEERATAIAELRANDVDISDDATEDEINAAIDELTKNEEESE